MQAASPFLRPVYFRMLVTSNSLSYNRNPMPQRLLLWQIRILPTPKTSSITYNCSNVKANDKPIKANSKPKTLQRKKRSGAIGKLTCSVNSDSSQLFLLIIKEANMLLKIYEENPNPREVAKVIHTLQDGGLIIYPTDTVYAIGCDALNVRAVEKICQIKGVNPQKSNLSIICYDLSNLSEYAKVNNAAFKLMKKNLPGPFTFILPTSNELPKIYKNRKEVGIRVPDNNIVRTIVQELGNPLLTMSVHDDDDEILEYSTDPELIAEKYNGRVDLVIDGGYGGLEPSTVVDCTTDEFEIVRQGKGQLK